MNTHYTTLFAYLSNMYASIMKSFKGLTSDILFSLFSYRCLRRLICSDYSLRFLKYLIVSQVTFSSYYSFRCRRCLTCAKRFKEHYFIFFYFVD